MANSRLTGSFQILFLYDVCEEIRTEQLQGLIGGGYGEIERRRDPALLHPSPEFVRFERPPVVQQLGPLVFDGGQENFMGELNYYDYGVVSLKLERPFELDWAELVALSSKWIADSKLEAAALQVVRRNLEAARPALVRSNQDWLSEDYYIIHLHIRRSQLVLHRFEEE